MLDSNLLTDVQRRWLLFSTLLRIVASLERVLVPHHFAKLFWLFQSGLLASKEPQKTNTLTKHINLTSNRIKMSNNFVLFLKYFATLTLCLSHAHIRIQKLFAQRLSRTRRTLFSAVPYPLLNQFCYLKVTHSTFFTIFTLMAYWFVKKQEKLHTQVFW